MEFEKGWKWCEATAWLAIDKKLTPSNAATWLEEKGVPEIYWNAVASIMRDQSELRYEDGEFRSFFCEHAAHFPTDTTTCRFVMRNFPSPSQWMEEQLENLPLPDWMANAFDDNIPFEENFNWEKVTNEDT